MKTHLVGSHIPKRAMAGIVFVALSAASCSSINLKAVEDPANTLPPTEVTEATPEVLGTVVTAAPTTTAAPKLEKGLSPQQVGPSDEPQSTVAVAVPESAPLVAEDSTSTTLDSSEADATSSTPASNETTSTTAEPTTTTTEAEPEPRIVVHNNYDPFATVGGFTMYLPAREVELVGFHESNHDGAQQVEPLADVVTPMTTMESRDRGNGSRTAIDVAVNIASEIRSPVTGTVVRAGTYTLYCQYSDDYAVIAPDEQPTWEVKVLHINGVQVKAGDRVIAQETVLAPGPTPLPFRSQIDKLTVSPPPPHVHIEVVDPSIPDRPSGGC